MKFNSYKNFIILILILGVFFTLCYFIMRVFLVFSAFENTSFFALFENDFLAMLKMGFRLDMRVICVILAMILSFGYLSSLNGFVFTKFGAKFSKKLIKISEILNAFFYKTSLILSTFSGFFIALSAFISYFYFQTYHTKIDIFIFGLKDDDTKAVIKIIFSDYPAFKVLFFSTFIAFLCFKIAKFSLNLRLNFTPKLFITLCLNLALILLVFIGIRGSFGTFPLCEDDHHISANPLINHIATNPIIAFAWAYGHYSTKDDFKKPNLADFEALQNELFPVFSRTKNVKISQKPHVIVVLMESFGSNMLYLDDEKEFDLLNSFRPHFEAGKIKQKSQNDFVFMNFLSSHDGTAQSFSQLFFESPSATLSLSKFKDKRLDFTPFALYKNAGYDAFYITSGYRSWQNLGDYLITLGADAVFDANFLAKHYKMDFLNDYGVADELAFNYALTLLKNASKPLFIVILTTNNHPPLKLHKNFTPPNFDLSTRNSRFRTQDEAKNLLIAQVFSYANKAFGDFISSVKNSPLKTHTIIASSGDHKHRELKAHENLALNHAVPFYLYVPNAYLSHFDGINFDFDPQKIASHKDIFPTLYALSLENTTFLTLGGRDLFDKKAGLNFAYNDAIFMDESGIYSTNQAFKFELNFLLNANFKDEISHKEPQSLKISPFKAKFKEKYEKLNRLQLEFRLFEN